MKNHEARILQAARNLFGQGTLGCTPNGRMNFQVTTATGTRTLSDTERQALLAEHYTLFLDDASGVQACDA